MTKTKKTSWGLVAIIGIGSFFSYSARSLFSPLLVMIEQDLGLTHAVSTQVFTYQSIGAMCSMFFSAYLLHRFTPKKLYVATLLGGGIFLCLSSLMPTFTYITYILVLAGLFFGVYNPTYLAILSQVVSPKHWATSTAYVELGVIISFIVTPLWITVYSEYYGWRNAVAIVGFFNMLAGIWYLLYGKGGLYPTPAVSLKHTFLLLQQAQIYIFALFYTAILVAEFSIYSISSVYLVSERGLELEHANTLLSLSRLASLAMVPLGGYLADKYPPQLSLGILIVLQILSICMFASPLYPLEVIGIFLQAGASSFGFPAVFSLIPYSFSKKDQSVVIALTSPIASVLGTGVIPLLLGYMGTEYTFALGLYGVAIFFAILTLVLFKIQRYHPVHSA